MICRHFSMAAAVKPAVQAMFDWDEYAVRDMCDEYELDSSGWELPVENLSDKMCLMMRDGEYEWDERVRFMALALGAIRNMVEYASDTSPSDTCYSTAEMLDAYDAIAEFVYRSAHDVHGGINVLAM